MTKQNTSFGVFVIIVCQQIMIMKTTIEKTTPIKGDTPKSILTMVDFEFFKLNIQSTDGGIVNVAEEELCTEFTDIETRSNDSLTDMEFALMQYELEHGALVVNESFYDDFYFEHDELVPHVDQLNGNNGSWTNTDDVEPTPKFNYMAMNRIRKEANTSVYYRKNGGKTKNLVGPSIGDQKTAVNVIAKEAAGLKADHNEVVSTDSYKYIVSSKHQYAVDENNVFYCRNRCGVYESPSGGVLSSQSLLHEGAHVHGVYKNNNIILQQGGHVNLHVTHSVRLATWKYISDGQTFLDGFVGYYYNPAILFLQDKLPVNGSPSIQRKKLALGLISKHMGYMPEELITNTIEHWDRLQHRMTNKVINDRNTSKVYNSAKHEHYDSDTLKVARGLRVNTQFDSYYSLPAKDCPLVIDWLPKDTYNVTMNGGRCDMTLGQIPTLSFDTQAEFSESSRYNKTVMMSFSGSDKTFTHYEMSGNNACLAAKRLLARRENEEQLYSNQLSVLSYLNSNSLISNSVLKTLLVNIKRDKVLIGSKDNKHEVSIKTYANPFMLAGVKKLFARVDRWRIDKFCDTAKNSAHWAYYSGYQKALELADLYTGRSCCAEIKHVKAKLRQQYVNGVQLHDDDDIMVNRLSGCVKKEWAKPGKVPRLFVAYEAGAMYANEMPEYIKVCLSEPFYFPKGELWTEGCVTISIMSKPKSDSIAKEFQALIAATMSDNEIHITIYSDDSVYSGMYGGISFGYNVDISSCDSSNNSLMFGLVGSQLANFNLERAQGLLKQCMLPIKVVNPDNKKESFTVNFHSAFEGSGTVLTTILNHNASYMIALGFVCELNTVAECAKKNNIIDVDNNNKIDSMYVDKLVSKAIVLGAATVGHLVTVDSWVTDGIPVYEKIQFLKHSPIRSVCGRWIPAQNYGCIFRSLGSLDGDMTEKQLGVSRLEFKNMSWSERSERFVASVVRGLVHEPKSSILESLRSRFQLGSTVTISDSVVRAIMPTSEIEEDLVFGVARSSYELDEVSVCRRYDIETEDLTELSGHISHIQLGLDSVTNAVQAFYAIDYGL